MRSCPGSTPNPTAIALRSESGSGKCLIPRDGRVAEWFKALVLKYSFARAAGCLSVLKCTVLLGFAGVHFSSRYSPYQPVLRSWVPIWVPRKGPPA
jgi:hypothetical protein